MCQTRCAFAEAALSLQAPTRPIEKAMPWFFNRLNTACDPLSECRIVPATSRWLIALRAAATARDAFIRESME